MLPRLIHPISITIERVVNSLTVQDDDYQEPVQKVVRTSFVVLGQVKWGMDKRLDATSSGAVEGSDGYILFRRVDLIAVGLGDVERGDRFIRMGGGALARPVDLYVTSIRPEGHYQDQGGATLLKAFFRDRQPVEQNRGG